VEAPSSPTAPPSPAGAGDASPGPLRDLRPVAEIEVGIGAGSIAVDDAAGLAYVASGGENSISVVDLESRRLRTTFPLEGSPMDVAVDPEAGLLYVPTWSPDALEVLDATSGRVLATVAVGQDPFRVALDPARDRAYVASVGSHVVFAVDTRVYRSERFLEEGEPVHVAVDPATGGLFVGHAVTSTVDAVDPDGNVTGTWKLRGGMSALLFEEASGELLAASGEANKVWVIDTERGVEEAGIRVGPYPIDLAADPSRGLVYVAIQASGPEAGSDPSRSGYWVIDLSKHRVLYRVLVGGGPASIGVSSDTRQVLVGTSEDGTVNVFSAVAP